MKDIFRIVKGKLKQVDKKRPWQNYLVDKALILGTGFMGGWTLYGIEAEHNLKEFCKFAYNTEPENDHEYGNYKSMYQDICDGNYGFGFDESEIEVIKTEIAYDFDKRENVSDGAL
jgi:hypothetical protein